MLINALKVVVELILLLLHILNATKCWFIKLTIKNVASAVHILMHFQECLIEMLQEMFGEDSVPKIFKGEKLYVTVDGKKANIDLLNLVSAILMYMSDTGHVL
jgi:hypothetical protein